MHVVIDSGDDWDFQVISGEHLWGLVDEDMSLFPVLSDMVFNLIEVHIRRPAVDVDNGQKQVFSRNHHLLKLFFQMLRAPRDV